MPPRTTRTTSAFTVYAVVAAAIVAIVVLAYMFRPPPVHRKHGPSDSAVQPAAAGQR